MSHGFRFVSFKETRLAICSVVHILWSSESLWSRHRGRLWKAPTWHDTYGHNNWSRLTSYFKAWLKGMH